jgi:hypothetical protein
MKSIPERRIFVAMPSYDGRMDVNTCFTIAHFQFECATRGWGFALNTAVDVAPISVARSQLCMNFMATAATDLFFLDADVACQPGAMSRMVEHPVDYVLGVYPTRQMDHSYAVMGLEDGRLTRDAEHGLVEIQAGPSGFMRVRRHVIEKMLDNIHYDDWFVIPAEGVRIPMLFKPIIGRKFTCSEDMYFGRRWRELGGKVWVDPELTLDHSGHANRSANFWKDYVLPNQLEKVA